MIFFTKTCARDWKRCCYQMLAIRRLFPLMRHVVMIERDEFMPSWRTGDTLQVDSRKIWKGAEDLSRRVAPLLETGEIRLAFVEALMPEAMAIEDAELRQQYVKLRAPIVFGEDMIQLDSDMCPKPVQTQWADELYRTYPEGGVGDQAKIRWDYYDDPTRYTSALAKWAETYAWFFMRDDDGALFRPGRRAFMGSQYGWYIERNVARSFFEMLGGSWNDSTLRNPRIVVDRILESQRLGLKFSEYQLFGIFASFHGRSVYTFRELHDLPSANPIGKIGDWSWLLHFSSKESLEPEQEAQLREAAGLV